jgi:nucleotide-binding universal stress UspA family protein
MFSSRSGVRQVVKTIVVPVDQSALSHSALPLARGLSGQLRASVMLFSCVHRVTTSLQFILQRDKERWTKYLSTTADTFGDTPVEFTYRYGLPAEQILEIASSADDPLIVMATRGRSPLSRTVLGSVARHVSRDAQCPVILVRNSNGDHLSDTAQTVERIALAHDSTTNIEDRLRKIQGIFGTSIDVHQTQTRSENLADTVTQIARNAEEVGADLIALETGPAPFPGNLIGTSLVERMIPETHLPVMVVRRRT